MNSEPLICGALLLFAALLGGCGEAREPVAGRKTPAAAAPPASSATASPPAAADASASAPAFNWVLPIFSDREGYRSMTLRGSEVRPGPGNSIAVTDLSIAVFSGDAEARIDSILLSSSARFFPKQNRATGEKALRFIQDTIEVTGEGWTYDHAAKKVSIHNNVRVTFRAQLNDILK